jgi:flagellar hook-associated protein FlgK
MFSTLAIGASGLRHAQALLGTSAHNIANLPTPGFRRQEAVAATAQDGGVSVSLRRSDVVGADLNADVVGLMQAKALFGANLQVFKAADAMMGSLLDVRG